LAELIEKNVDTLATVECLDNGLKKSLAMKFVQTSANRLRFFSGVADKVRDWMTDLP
jgi:acyl-CoA reductase-like NAD-dependent aldehyde dehydrogenase